MSSEMRVSYYELIPKSAPGESRLGLAQTHTLRTVEYGQNSAQQLSGVQGSPCYSSRALAILSQWKAASPKRTSFTLALL
ncbi:MAG: hypothetical protein HW388_1360 [Dehalococcoidia bacterium]|nr:hypothetical protein [Dehalococcoidia bacterium]